MAVREGNRLFGVAGGALIEALAGIAGTVLAILGLVGIAPAFLLGVAIIVIGGAMLFQGLSVGAEYRRLSVGATLPSADIGSGVAMEVLGGVSTVVLGILGLLRIAPGILLPAAAIVIGSSLALSSGVVERLGGLTAAGDLSRQSLGAAVGVQALVGLAVIVLGVLALVGINALVLSLVALLAASVSVLLSGFAMGGTMIGTLER
jgi:hypothetical protein